MADLTLDGTNLTKAGATEKSDSLKQVFPESYWADRFNRAGLKNRYELTGPSEAMEVQSKVKTLQETLSSFRWPADGFGLRDARLVVNDPALDNKISASITPKDDVQRYYRFYSRGFTGESPTLLDSGIYKFDMMLGADKSSLEVELTKGMDNNAVLEAVRDAVNDSTLPVQARIIKQNVPGANLDDLLGTGSALAFSVNTAYVATEENRGDSTQNLDAANELSFSDSSGHLISHLKLDETQKPIGPAIEARYDLSGLVAGSSSNYLSKAFDANGTTTLASGEHSIGYTIGAETGTITFRVADGDSWETVLGRIEDSAAGASSKITAEVVDAKLVSPVYTGDDYYLIDGKSVSISAVSPKMGERLTLELASGLEVLGLNATAHPGADSVMVINGTTEVRAPSEFALDNGRVLVDLEQNFGDTLPLRVASGVEEMKKNVGLVTDAYNDLRKTILPSEELFREGFADLWRDPVVENRVDLSWMGFREAEKDKEIWFDSDKFYAALIADPDKVQKLLDDEDGLFTKWQEVNDQVIENKVSSYLIPETSLPGPWLPEPSPRTELELEKKRELVDTFDETFNFDFDTVTDDTGRLFSKKG
ncbi:hypothetical protein [Maridesulfovibrio hydrothermalis]|uniref:hypothetical protein n=1 Tax=Maridesulfovibrio hydrothermalis TaxID=191026 RepID=UPI001FE100E3|nr:hypothetical protein [Maridesulfovibrio hydrothermalis]